MATNRICPSCGSEIKQGSEYCLMCGAVYGESLPVSAPSESTEGRGGITDGRVEAYALRMLRRSRVLGVLLALCIVLLAVSGIISHNLSKRQSVFNAFADELNSEIQSLSEENAELSAENASLSEQRDCLDAQLKALLGDDDGVFRLSVLDTLIGFQARHGSDNVKFADYGADRSLVFVHAGESTQLLVHFEYTDSLLYWALEKENIVSPEWGTAWVGTTCPLTLTGLEPGCCEIMFGSDYSDDVFYVLCIVLP